MNVTARFVLAATLVLALVPTAPAVAQSGPNRQVQEPVYYWAGGRRQVLVPTLRWVGVELTREPDSLQVARVLNRLSVAFVQQSEKPLVDRTAMHVLVPLRPLHSAQVRQVRNRLAGGAVRRTLRLFENGEGPPIVETDELVVRFKPEVTPTEAFRILNEVGADTIRALGRYAPNGYLARVRGRTASSIEAANRLHERSDVEYAHPNLITPPSRPQRAPSRETPRLTSLRRDSLQRYQWHLSNDGSIGGRPGGDIRVQDAWTVTRGDPAVVVAVMDDGFDLNHEDLRANYVAGYDFVDDDSIPAATFDARGTSCATGMRWECHGTAVAGLIAAVADNQVGIAGVAPQSRIMPIRLLGAGSPVEATARALVWAADHGAWIISNSWGPAQCHGTVPGVVENAITYAIKHGRRGKGTVIIFAACNFNQPVRPGTYAAHPNVLAVAASTYDDTRASYSNFGPDVDIAAPSGDRGLPNLVTTDASGRLGYSEQNYTSPGNDGFGGTSGSVPLVSGVAALILSQDSTLRWDQVFERITRTADPIDFEVSGYNRNGHSDLFGAGRVNAARALAGDSTPRVELIEPTTTVGGPTFTFRARPSHSGAGLSAIEFQRRAPVHRVGRSGLAIPGESVRADTIEITDSLAVSEVVVSFEIEHPWPRDLNVYLVPPGVGQGIQLLNSEDTDITETEIRRTIRLPNRSLRSSTAGPWVLAVYDGKRHDDGTLLGWSLTINPPWATVATAAAADPATGEWAADWSPAMEDAGTYQFRARAVGPDKRTLAHDVRDQVEVLSR